MTDDLDGILGALIGAPQLPGAKCVGRHQLFDPPADHEPAEHVAARHDAAIRLCRSCDALADCESWLDSLTPSRKPPGVTAGRIHIHRTDKRRKTA